MRTVSFSKAPVQTKLENEFLCSYTDITGTKNTGKSFKHAPQDAPGSCGRGAGRQNVQTIFLTPRGKIFHVATGYLSSDDLMGELEFASSTYDAIQDSNPQQATRELVGIHAQRMSDLGFSRDQIYNPSEFQEMKTGFSPSDLGFTSSKNSIFGDIGANRMLRDAQFTMRNPLMSRSEFMSNPTELVGSRPSFFGSNIDMNKFGIKKENESDATTPSQSSFGRWGNGADLIGL